MKKLFKNLMLFCLLTVGVCFGFTTLSYGQAVVSVDPPQLASEWSYKDTFIRHTGLVRALAFSPDGQMLASGGADSVINLLNPVTGGLLRSLRGHTRVITSVAFSKDGRMLASSSADGDIRLWNPQTGSLLRTILGAHRQGVQSIDFSPDGRFLASGGRDNTTCLWNTQTGDLVSRIPGQTDWVLDVAFSADGRLLASASRDRTIRLRNSSGNFIRSLQGHTDFVTSVAFAPTGELVSGSRDLTVRSWNPETGSPLRVFRGHTHHVNHVSVSLDGTIASGSTAVRLWDLQTGESVGVLNENLDGVRVVAFSPDGLRLASGDESGNVVLYERIGTDVIPDDHMDDGIPDTNLRPATADFTYKDTFVEDAKPVRALAFSPVGIILASGGYNRAINLWNAATGQLLETVTGPLKGHTRSVTAIAFSPSDPLLLASSSVDGSIRLWNSIASQHLRTIDSAHPGGVQSVAFSPDGRLLASGGRDNTGRLWDPETGSLVATLPGHTDWVLGVAFSADGRLLASASRDRTIRLWSSSGQYLRSLRGHTDFVTSVAFASTGELVSGSRDLTVRSWNPETGSPLRVFRGHTHHVNAVSVSVDGTIASGATTVHLWDLQTGQPLGALDENPDGVRAVAFSPGGHWLASGDESGNVVLYEGVGAELDQPAVDTDYVYMPDPNLRSIIKAALGKASGATITPSDMMTLTSVEADRAGIQDLTGLELATNLTNLSLAYNQISDVSTLTQLKKLTALQLSYNQLSNVSVFSQFKQLTKLRLDGNGISDVSALSALKNLKVLGLGRNRISDVSPLKQLKQLTWLYLSYNEISDVSVLAGLTNLRALYLSYNEIADFSPLAGLVKKLDRYENGNQRVVDPNVSVHIPDSDLRAAIEHALGKTPDAIITRSDMQTLTILDTSEELFEPDEPTGRLFRVSDLTGIEFAVNLTKLNFSYSFLLDLSALAGLKNLTHLTLVSNPLSDGSSLSGLKSLTHLDLSDNRLSDVSALSGLTNLRKLDLASNHLSDISALSGLTNLTRLILNRNEIADVSPLSSLTNLTYLDLHLNEISDVSVLSGLTSLTDLDLSKNRISDISVLSDMTNLTYLNLGENRISDISALSDMTSLTDLDLSENRISDISVLSDMTNLTYLNLAFNNISDVSALSDMTDLRRLVLVKNRIVDFAPIAELVKNLELYSKDPQLKSLIPHSVEFSGTTTVTSVLKDYGFTATVKNTSGQGLGNVEVTVNGSETIRTNGRGEAKFSLNFASVGAHDITVKVRDKESGTEFDRRFPNKVEVLKPHSIEFVKDRREIEKGAFYTADFVVKSADGRALEGFQVKLSVGKWTFETIQTRVQMYISSGAIQGWFSGVESFFYFDPNDPDVVEFYRRDPDLLNLLNAGVKEVDFFGWRVSSVASDKFNMATTDNEGKARCHQRLLSTGFYGVSATVLLNGQEFLTTSFSGSEESNRIFINPAKNLNDAHFPVIGPFYQVASTWIGIPIWARIEAEDDSRLNKQAWGAPVDPPSYRVEVVPFAVSCGTTVPPADIQEAAETLYSLVHPPESPSVSFFNLTVDESTINLKPNTTTSLDPTYQWTTSDTVATDVGIPVITVRFLDGTEDQKKQAKAAFRRWMDLSEANFHFIFSDEIVPDERVYTDELSDIRVSFNESEWGSVLDCADIDCTGVSWVGKSDIVIEVLDYYGLEWLDRLGATLFDWGKHQSFELEIDKTNRLNRALRHDPTMGIKTVNDRVLLHEIGHALGFHHPHGTSAFAEAFEWPPKNTSAKQTAIKRLGKDVFDVDLVPADTASVDPESVMTYWIPPEALVARDSAPSYLKDLADGTGISTNNELSQGDLRAAANVYRKRSEISKERGVHRVIGTVSINGVDFEPWPFSNETIKETHQVAIYVGTQKDYSYSFLTEFRWGGECRVEVDIGTRGITADGSIEMSAQVRLYEGAHEATNQLEDENTIYFTIGPTETSTEEAYVENPVVGGKDHATVTINLRNPIPISATSIGPLAPILASSADIANSDVNGDGQVDAEDLILVSNALGQTNLAAPRLDVNRDGMVTIADLVQVAQYLGQSTHSSAPAQVVVPARLTYKTVQEWIDNAHLANDGSLMFRQGIAKLEYLLTVIIPKKTVLLHNYPNPFNPETWIPYHLAEPADVTLTIYSVDGKVVRRLDLGHQAAGYYRSKSRAAYWDGRNNVGERVASGIYFYTITAGDFAATKKMLILK